jgi:cell fate regulator YaaT (PSP1 superfamily)
VKVVRVRLRDQGNPVTYAVPEGAEVSAGETVILEGERGTTWGLAVGHARTPPASLSCCQRPRGTLTRTAALDDLDAVARLRHREAEALDFCRVRVEALGLPMKVTEMEGVLSGKNLTCFFTSDRRVDFRQLVKDLGGRLRCHVLMHQIGTREEARRACGIGPCGRDLCCSTFLGKPKGVSSREARRAAPGVAHAKLTGLCGKLMCCLAYEDAPEAGERALVSLS